jgi:outer membrane protein assembly factor BamB
VYYGDEKATTVRGLWSGSINGESKTVSGALTSSSVLYFKNPGRGELLSQEVTFTAKTDGAERSLSMPVSSGTSWESSLGKSWDESTGVVFTYYGQPRAITLATGRRLWESESRLSDSRPAGGVSDSFVYCFDGFTIVRLNRRTGVETLRKEVHQRSYTGGNLTRGLDILVLPDAIYATCYYDNGSYYQLFRLDPATLETVWKSNTGGGTLVSVSRNLYICYETSMERIDPGTGAMIGRQLPLGSAAFSGNGVFGTDGRKISRFDTNLSSAVWSSPVPAKAMVLWGDVLYATGQNAWALSTSDGRILWEREVSGKNIMVSRTGVLVGSGSSLTSLHPETGHVQWTSPVKGDSCSLSGSYLLHSGGCIDLRVMYEE